jgi:hypothetical protein
MERGIILSAREQLKLDLIGKVDYQNMERDNSSMIFNFSLCTLKN